MCKTTICYNIIQEDKHKHTHTQRRYSDYKNCTESSDDVKKKTTENCIHIQ